MKRNKASNAYTFKNYSFQITHDKKNIDASWHLIEIDCIEELIQYFAD